MRCFLVLTIALVLVLGGLYPRPALTQVLQGCTVGLPSLSDFPKATETCKYKLTLAPIPVTPDVIFTRTVQCGMAVTVCGGESKCWKAPQPEEKKDGVCKAYYDRVDELANREICCDLKCERDTPWFDGRAPKKCKDRQAFQTSHDAEGWVFLKVCGQSVFAYKPKDKDVIVPYKQALLDHVRGMVGPTVCCDSFNARGPGSSCNPSLDLDCDGTSNATDRTGDGGAFPDISTFGVAPGVPITDTDPLPPWFQPSDKDFMPDPYLCEQCKWELVKGRRTCSPDGKKNHVYQATWRCPYTGNTKSTRKEAPATEPCGPAPEAIGSFLLFPDRQYANGFRDSFLRSRQQDRTSVLGLCGTEPAGDLTVGL